jgi:diguanylate cyclase (GGDEF)-like protein
VVSLDLDRFKQINDRFGHAAGDRVLQATADVVRAVGRESDRCGRLGGEELLLVLPDTEAEGAARAAERVRQALRSLALPALQGGSVTASFGVATLCPGEGFASLLERADEALYAAKRQGRDQVCVSASPCEQISARTAT